MNNYFLIAAIAFLAYFIIKIFRTNQIAKTKIQGMKQDPKKLFLVDVRQPEEFRTGSVKNAVNIPLGEVQKRINEFKNKENIVVFCRSGNRSGQATSILKQNDIENVTNGGTWQNVASAIG
jgi:rhodanese-related sulfurtransferase